MRFSLAFTVVVLLGVWCMHRVAAQDFVQCSFTDPTTNKSYDLTPLANLYGSKAAATDPVRGNVPCIASIRSTAVCQQRGPTSYPLGSTDRGTVSPLPNGVEGFVVKFSSLDNRGSNVSYICDPKAGEGKFKWTYTPPSSGPQPFLWQFEWRTSYACPSGGSGGGGGSGGASSDSGGLAGGWIFIICLVSVTFVYFASGLAVQKFYFKREGLEIMTNSRFWLALPGLVKDGHVFLFNSARRMCGRGYQQI